MKLNGWQRIGIVASVVWATGAYVHTFETENRGALLNASMADYYCIEHGSGQPDISDRCRNEKEDSLRESRINSRNAAVLIAVVPIPLGWCFAYLLIFIVRWIKRGFSPSDLTTP